MKLKRIASLCSQTGRFILYDRKDEDWTEQWLGDGCAAYPINGLPYMDVDNICTMFDIPEKKKEKLIMRKIDAADVSCINWRDTDPSERQIDDQILHLRYEGRELLPLRTTMGVVFIQEKYLTPLDSLEYMELFERRTSVGIGVYIVAKIGMIIQAVIMPVDVVNNNLIEQLEELTRLCRSALMKAEQGEDADREQSALFLVDERTGEVVGKEWENE